MRYFLLAIVGALMWGCGEPQYRRAAGATWGTTYSIVYKAADDLSDSIIAVMRQVDMSLSPFERESLVSKVNRGEPAKADSMLAGVMLLSQQVCRLSGGAFDPTVAPLVNLWGFGYRNTGEAPTRAAIDSALACVGIMECGINADGTIRKKRPETEFNFSAIAKGYGVDAIAAMLRRNGCEDYMVEVGGEIALAGQSPKGTDWRIQIDAPVLDPTSTMHERLTVLELTDRCIATSGNYRNFRAVGDSLVGHTIHPATGRPVSTTTLSVTVIAPSTALADALATAAMAMLPEQAAEMLEGATGVEALIVSATPDSAYAITTIPALSGPTFGAGAPARGPRSW